MTKEFVSYEQAISLGKLGFNEECLIINGFTKPLKQQVFRWFREKYNLHSYVKYEFRDVKFYYDYTIEGYESDINYDTYEEAENALINELISIAKRKIK